MSGNEGEVTPEKRDDDRKPYSKPAVTVHGSLQEITRALGSGSKDGLTGSVLL